ncbi:MAG: amidohydrolase family protein [Gammaproteobacteria bacterium]|nr:amidohydrolase family protein [Gammaproteobacteria bacterium]
MPEITSIPFNDNYRRIATEEAWASPELLQMYADLYNSGKIDDPGFDSLWGFYGTSNANRPATVRRRLADLDEERLADMDAAGIDFAVLALTSPGVQVFDRDTAISVAKDTNDIVKAAVDRHPDRYAALCAIAPQAPELAAQELERCKSLGFKGIINNSHTHGEYLSDPKFWPIFEAAEAMDMPIYLHPNTPPRNMIEPMLEAGLDGAVFGFGVETGLHMLRIITAGVFDRFPKLQIIIGHMGESLPYWMYRLDFMHNAQVSSNRYEALKPLKKKVSDYMKENVYITCSGMAWEPAVRFAQQTIGVDRVMYAMDYPYQYVLQEVTDMDNMDISDAEKKMFYEKVATSVFKL